MREISETQIHETGSADRGNGAEVRPVRTFWRRPAIVAPVTAAALTIAVVVGVSVTRDAATGPRQGPDDPTASQGKGSEGAAELLEQIAKAAEKQPFPEVGDDQFVYVKRVSYHWKANPKMMMKVPKGCATTAEGHEWGMREFWESVDGQHAGLSRDDGPGGKNIDRPIARPLPGKDMPNYFRQVEELPTDPAEMYRWLYDLQKKGDKPSGKRADDVKAYGKVVRLLTSQLLPPRTAAALYRAAAMIPGLTVVKGVAEDAAGRHGVAVAMNESNPFAGPDAVGTRTELVFSEKTFAFLGETTIRIVGPKDKCDPRVVGDLVEARAAIDRAVVDKIGQNP
jgi:hypothetical protein